MQQNAEGKAGFIPFGMASQCITGNCSKIRTVIDETVFNQRTSPEQLTDGKTER